MACRKESVETVDGIIFVMPKIERHAPGTFCWVELRTTDQNNPKSFYATLFGWTVVDLPVGPDAHYTMFQRNGSNAAAAFGMSPQERSTVPPHWSLYIAVDNADESAKRAGELGAKIIEAPFDVM